MNKLISPATNHLTLVWFATLCIALVGLSGCGENAGKNADSTTPDQPQAHTLVILCGSSFTLPVQDLIAAFTARHPHISIDLTSAGSSEFLPLVQAAQRGDLLITHDPYLDLVRDAGYLADHAQVGYLAPALVVQAGNPSGVHSLADLGRPGLRIALPHPDYSTCGKVLMPVLEALGVLEQAKINADNRMIKGHSGIGNLVKLGAVDAAVMWNGVAATFAPEVAIVPVTQAYSEEYRIHVMGLSYSQHPDSVQAFVDFTKEVGSPIFHARGYSK